MPTPEYIVTSEQDTILSTPRCINKRERRATAAAVVALTEQGFSHFNRQERPKKLVHTRMINTGLTT